MIKTLKISLLLSLGLLYLIIAPLFAFAENYISDKRDFDIFSSSPFSLPQNNIFSIDGIVFQKNLNGATIALKNCFSQNNIDFYIDGVKISEPYKGFTDFSSIYFLQNQYKSANYNNSSIPLAAAESLDFCFDTSKSTRLNNLIASAGNTFGNVAGNYSIKYRSLFFYISGNYINSSGYPLSQESRNFGKTAANYMLNSNFTHSSIMSQVSMNMGDSYLSLMYASFANSKNIPLETFSPIREFLQMPKQDMDLINFKYKTQLNDEITLNGNIFYLAGKTLLKSFDDSTYSSQELAYTYNRLSDYFSYGATIGATILSDYMPPLDLNFLYRRDVDTEQEDFGLPTKQNETESIHIIALQKYRLDSLSIVLKPQYSIYKPLYSEILPINKKISSYGFNLNFSYQLDSNLLFALNINNAPSQPSIREIFNQQIDSINRTYLNAESATRLEASTEYNSPHFLLKIGLAYNFLNNKIMEKRDSLNEIYFVNSDAINCISGYFNLKTHLDNINFNIRYDFNTNKAQEYYLAPNHILYCSMIYNLFNNTYAMFSFNYFSKTEINIPFLKSQTREPISLLNFKLIHNLIGNNELFVVFNNLLDRYYESSIGQSAPGRSYYLGIKLGL